MKPKLSYDSLIKEKILGKGITAKWHNEEEIIEILATKTYFYRLFSFRKNFKKDKKDKYIGLDFDALVDMSIIDKRLKEFLLMLCIDIEHYTKTKIMDFITNDPKEDGYQILEDFIKENNKNKRCYNQALNKFSKNRYLKDMYEKRLDSISVWVFLEILDFGQLILFLNFYHHRVNDNGKKNNEIQQLDRTLKFVKNVRNACAHNNIYLINLYSDNLIIKNGPISEIRAFSNSMGINQGQIKYMKINDLIAVFYLYKRLSPNESKQQRFLEGESIVERMKEKEFLYSNSQTFQRFLPTFQKMVDFLN